MGLSVLLAVGWRGLERRRLRDPAGIVRGLARAVDPERAERALRALSLIGPAGDVRADGTSAELARLHVSRTLAQLPSRPHRRARSRRSRARVGLAALVVGVCVLGVALANAWSVLEGADVLVARHGDGARRRCAGSTRSRSSPARPTTCTSREQHEVALCPLTLAYGTLVTVRGVPAAPGPAAAAQRRHDRGARSSRTAPGAVVARWPLTASTTLHVVARFGDVVVPRAGRARRSVDPGRRARSSTLEGAPREARLLDADARTSPSSTRPPTTTACARCTSSCARARARSGACSRGSTARRRSNKGGQVLKLRDPFLAQEPRAGAR